MTGAAPQETTQGFVPHYRLLLKGLGIDAATGGADGQVAVDAAFLRFLMQEFARLLPFDAAFYGRDDPELAGLDAAALHRHFVTEGFEQGRAPHPLAFDAETYLRYNPDLAGLLARDGMAGVARHFDLAGRFEGRIAHPAEVETTRRWAEAANATPYRLASRTIEAARIQPFLHPLVAPEPLGFRGGLVLGDGALDRRLRHRRARQAVDAFPPNENSVGLLAGEYVYGGPAYHHFGHVMAEMVHRILPSRVMFACRDLLFVGAGLLHEIRGFDALAPAMQAPLLFLGVQPEEVTVLHDDRVVEVLHVAEQGSTLGAGPLAPYLDMLSAYTPARLDRLHDGAPAAELLYVSRSRLQEGGLLLGESYLEELLQHEGWQVFHPQDHTLVDQMQAYHRARIVIFTGGSACHGAELFGRDGLDHCVLLPRGHTGNEGFEAVLRPRARRYDSLPSAELLGSLVFHPQTEAVLEYLGVAVLDLAVMRDRMRALGLARLDTMDPAAYRERALADLLAYVAFQRSQVAFHRAQGTRIVQETEIAELLSRFEQRMGA